MDVDAEVTGLLTAAFRIQFRVAVGGADNSHQFVEELDKALEYARGRPRNEITIRQWRIPIDTDGNLLGGFLARWKKESTPNEAYVSEKKRQVRKAFTTIIEPESGKIKPEDAETQPQGNQSQEKNTRGLWSLGTERPPLNTIQFVISPSTYPTCSAMADFDDVLDALKDEVADRGAAIATGSWRFVVHVHFRSVPTSLLAAPPRGFTLSPAVCIL